MTSGVDVESPAKVEDRTVLINKLSNRRSVGDVDKADLGEMPVATNLLDAGTRKILRQEQRGQAILVVAEGGHGRETQAEELSHLGFDHVRTISPAERIDFSDYKILCVGKLPPNHPICVDLGFPAWDFTEGRFNFCFNDEDGRWVIHDSGRGSRSA